MKALIFGEILYDVYNSDAIIGGAPLNYALQLKRLNKLSVEGKSVAIITALGNDDFGKSAIDFVQKEGIDTALIQVKDKFETGRATVFLDEKTKVPDYIIHENVAWDNIEYSDEISHALASNQYDIFYCNILALRSEQSLDTFKKVIETIKPKLRVFDITIRKSFYTKEKIQMVLDYINVLKVNDDELEVLRELFYPSIETSTTETDRKTLMESLMRDFELEYIFLTLGKSGASLLCANGYFFEPSNDVVVVDTVGAGDSFCAALSYGLYKNIDEAKVLKLALQVAEQMVQVRGGTGVYDVASVLANY